MSVDGPLYVHTGESFCNVVNYLNGIAMLQNWVGGFGIAVMRAIYIQNLSIFPIREKQVVLLLGISYLTVVLGANHFWYRVTRRVVSGRSKPYLLQPETTLLVTL